MSGLVSVFSSIILLATVSTLALALLAYTAYKVRERRKPQAALEDREEVGDAFRPIFIRRHTLEDIAPEAHGERSMAAGGPPAQQTGAEK